MDMSPQGLAVVRSFEGRALKAYKDSVGVVTIGYGNTNYDKFAVAYLGKKIEMGDTITEAQAEYLLIETMTRNYMPSVTKTLGETVPQTAADCGGSFHYNTGAIARASWVKLFKSGAADGVIEASLLSWNKAGGKALAGLTRRRKREAAILLRGDYGPEGRTSPPILDASGKVIAIAVTSPAHPLAGTPGMMRLDDVGEHITDLNNSLAELGYKTTVNGDRFTLSTQDAIMAIQKSHPGLTVDGIAGPATRAVIGREIDLKRKALTLGSVTGGAGATGGAIEALTTSGIPGAVWIAAGVLAVVAIGWLAYRYSDEVIALTKRG